MRAAVRHLRREVGSDVPIAVIGASQGARASGLAFSGIDLNEPKNSNDDDNSNNSDDDSDDKLPHVAQLVLLAPPPFVGAERLSDFAHNVLFVANEGEALRTGVEAMAAECQAKAGEERCRLRLLSGAWHAQHNFKDETAGAALLATLVNTMRGLYEE